MARRVLVFMLVLSIVLSMLVMIYAYPIGHRAVVIHVQAGNPVAENPVPLMIYLDDSYTIVWNYIHQFQFETPYVLIASKYMTTLHTAVAYLDWDNSVLWINVTDILVPNGEVVDINIIIAEKNFIYGSYLAMTEMHYGASPYTNSLPFTVISYGYMRQVDLPFRNASLGTFNITEYTGHSAVEKSLVLYPYAVEDNAETCTRTIRYVAGGYATPYIDYPLKITISYPETVENAQIRIVLNQTNFVAWNIDPSSIYFKDYYGNTLYYWIEKWDPEAPEAIIWLNVTVPNIVYMFYGTGDYSQYNDHSKVFIFYEDFNDQAVDSNVELGTDYGEEYGFIYVDDVNKYALWLNNPDDYGKIVVHLERDYSFPIAIEYDHWVATISNRNGYVNAGYFDGSTYTSYFALQLSNGYIQTYDGSSYVNTEPPTYYSTSRRHYKLIILDDAIWIVSDDGVKHSIYKWHQMNSINYFRIATYMPGHYTYKIYVDNIKIYRYVDENKLTISFDVEYPQQLLLPDYTSMDLELDHIDYYYGYDHDVITSAEPNSNVSFQFPAEKYYIFLSRNESYSCGNNGNGNSTGNGTVESWTVPDLDINVNMHPVMALTGLAVITTVLILLFFVFGEYAIAGVPISLLGLSISGIVPAWFAYLTAILLIMFIVFRFIKGGNG